MRILQKDNCVINGRESSSIELGTSDNTNTTERDHHTDNDTSEAIHRAEQTWKQMPFLATT